MCIILLTIKWIFSLQNLMFWNWANMAQNEILWMSTPLNFYSYNGILNHISPHTNTGVSTLLIYVQSRTVPNWGTLLSCTSDITTVSFILGSNRNYLDIKAIFQKYLKRALTCLRTATIWEWREPPVVKPKVKYWNHWYPIPHQGGY